jgi:putative peptidoglycan lipid II flippase
VSLKQRSSSKNAVLVGTGILSSRLIGLVRERLFAHYFGNSGAADALRAAFKIPNFLQNLFGEGALSSSFIPTYANLLATGKEEEAHRVARVVGSILTLAISLIVLVGVLTTPYFFDLVAAGFVGEKRELTIRMVRIAFPGAGILVLSAWCLGILNSHRRFFLPYAASILWNLAIIGVLIRYGGHTSPYPLAEIVTWGAVAGSLLQFSVQLPSVIKLAGSLRFQIDTVSSSVRTVIKNFIPGVAGRGVNQISGYIDLNIASLLPESAVATMGYAQQIYMLPVSLFGMSISIAELPEMASQSGSEEVVAEALCKRLNNAMHRVAFFVIPSVLGLLVMGDSIITILYQSGKFTHNNGQYVWGVLAGYAIGLLAATLGRLYTSAFWALKDTRTPLRFAIIRVTLAAGLGWLLAFPIPKWFGLSAHLGLIGLTVASGMAAWVEFTLLRLSMNRRIGRTGLQAAFMAKLWGIAIGAAALAFAIKLLMKGAPTIISSALVLLIFGMVYFAAAAAFRIPEATQLVAAISDRLRKK